MNRQILVTGGIVFAVACGSESMRGRDFESEGRELTATSPVESVRVETFGFPGDDIRQRVWVVLEAGAQLEDVLDMSIFGSARPGFTHDDAAAALGEPDSTAADECGGKWLKFELSRSTVVIGCEHDTGIAPISTHCWWRLYAEFEPNVAFVKEPLRDYLREARSVPQNVRQREMILKTSDYSATVQYYFDPTRGRPYARWNEGGAGGQYAFCWAR